MNKKTTASLSRIVLISFVMLFSMAAVSSAVTSIVWSNSVGDSNWSNTANWTGGIIPDAIDDYAKINKASGPVFSTGRTATAYRVLLEGSNGTLTVSSGTLNANNHIYVATLATDTATLNMSGGAINITGTFYVARDPGSNATVNLLGGTITCGTLNVRQNIGSVGTINIEGNGKLIFTSTYNNIPVTTWIANGWITAYNGAVPVVVDTNTNPGKTTITASVLAKPGLPSPEDNAANVDILTDLSWMSLAEATSHNVYFGTSSSPAFVGNQTATTFDPGILDFNTTYYWRIDEVIGGNIVTGDPWTFSTVSGLAETPNPVSGATEVALNKILSWTPGYGDVSHDVYLGTDVNAVRDAERLEGDLDGDGRVDGKDLLILTNYWLENPVGSEPYAGINGDNIVDFRDYALLANNWMVQGSPLFKGNTTNTSYDALSDFATNTTYYWRVDEVSGADRRKGSVWSFTATIYSESLFGKVMCGYQGWFNCPGDGTTLGWKHWSKSSTVFDPNKVRVDMWPDMTEITAGEKFEVTGFLNGSNHYYVFSSHNRDTILRHFQWMQQYGIDGVYLQRFAKEIKKRTDAIFYHRNDVLDYCKDAANLYGRKYAVMYDLSGLHAGETSYVIDDWKYLVDTMQVTKDPADHAYMHHRDKPVVVVWGIGFNDGRDYSPAECLGLVNFLRNDPVYGGNIVIVGVPSYWRTLNNDCLPDPNVHAVVRAADIVSPWSVGRYPNSAAVTFYADNVWTPDVNWCRTNSTPSHPIDYLPVIYPGYSAYNANKGTSHPKIINEQPRCGGQFLWDQVKATVSTANANMLYVAMFDEVDEGTAIFKITNAPPTTASFLTYRQDLPSPDGGPGVLPAGAELPSDEYLWLTGQAGRGLRGEIPLTSTRPVR